MKVITLCGSTKFKQDFLNVDKWLTLQSNVVISVGLFGQVDNEPIFPEEKILLDEIHKAKIELADEIFVINSGGYVGNSTKNEIEYARSKHKNVRFFTDEQEDFEIWLKKYNKREQTDWNK